MVPQSPPPENVTISVPSSSFEAIAEAVLDKAIDHRFDENRLLDAKAAAERLSINVQTLYRFGREGLIPCVNLGAKCVRFRVKDIDAFIESRISDREAAQEWALRVVGRGGGNS